MSEPDDRALGRLEGKMELVLEGMDKIQVQLTTLSSSGCQAGVKHSEQLIELSRRIDSVEKLPLGKLFFGTILGSGGVAGLVEAIRTFWKGDQ
jgi:hypothetical protein